MPFRENPSAILEVIETTARVIWLINANFSLLGKLITWGETRKQAISRAYYANSELAINGFPTNSSFHRVVLANPEFHKGNITTHFIEENEIIPYIKEAFNRRVAALFASGIKTSKVFLPDRSKDSKWKETSKLETTGRY